MGTAKDGKPADSVHNALEKIKPYVGEVGLGTVMGYCSGSAAKTLTKSVAVVVGFLYIGLQTAASKGYIDLNWKKIKADTIDKMDKDGDGKLTISDAQVYWKKLKAMLTDQLPSASGFSVGFLYGFTR